MWLGAGHPDKALEAFEKEVIGAGELGAVMALHDLGRMVEFEERFAGLYDEDDPNPEGVARVYAWIGNNDKAFEWLDKAVEIHGSRIVGSIDTDYYEIIKSDPRWRALREKHGHYDVPVEDVEIKITLPPGVTID